MIKKDRRFSYLPPITNLNPGFYKGNEDWSVTAMVIYDPAKRKDLDQPEPASGSYQMIWPVNPWAALSA